MHAYGSTSWKHVVDTEMEIVAPRDSACMACFSSREGEEVLNQPKRSTEGGRPRSGHPIGCSGMFTLSAANRVATLFQVLTRHF